MTFSTLLGLTSQTHARLGLWRSWMSYIVAADQFPSSWGSHTHAQSELIFHLINLRWQGCLFTENKTIESKHREGAIQLLTLRANRNNNVFKVTRSWTFLLLEQCHHLITVGKRNGSSPTATYSWTFRFLRITLNLNDFNTKIKIHKIQHNSKVL